MQTIEEYKEYTKQLEGEVKQWHDAFDASQAKVKELVKENLRLERERVEQNSIIETCANELEELRLHEVYSKSEADAVIAEKDKEIAELEERIADDDKDFEMANSQNERLLKIVRHHKYKRCLAMARRFKIMSILAADYRVPREKWNFYEKWHNRWLELSEKFKDKETK